MIDPREKDEQEENQVKVTSDDRQTDNAAGANWDEHQRVDEEGNEVDPEDVS